MQFFKDGKKVAKGLVPLYFPHHGCTRVLEVCKVGDKEGITGTIASQLHNNFVWAISEEKQDNGSLRG